MGIRAVLSTKSPAEYVQKARRDRNILDSGWILACGQIMRPPPKSYQGYTLVQYYTDAQKVVRELDAELKAYVPLEPSGTLDLQKVNQEWGLENCIIVDPLDDTRIRIPPDGFLPADIVKLQNLRYGSVMVIEGPISKATARQRAYREIYVLLWTFLAAIYQLVHDLFIDFFKICTPIPFCYRQSVLLYKSSPTLRGCVSLCSSPRAKLLPFCRTRISSYVKHGSKLYKRTMRVGRKLSSRIANRLQTSFQRYATQSRPMVSAVSQVLFPQTLVDAWLWRIVVQSFILVMVYKWADELSFVLAFLMLLLEAYYRWGEFFP